jgi:hypothetical protein
MITFVDDDNSSGLVVNGYRKPSAQYVILHRARCKTIQGSPAKGSVWTSGDFCKIWSPTSDELALWAHSDLGAVLHPCGICKPLVDAADAPHPDAVAANPIMPSNEGLPEPAETDPAGNSDLPFLSYPHGGRKLLGPVKGGTCRRGYGLKFIELTGQHCCAYCGMDFAGAYGEWLQMALDHVVPVSTGKAKQIPDEWLEEKTFFERKVKKA